MRLGPVKGEQAAYGQVEWSRDDTKVGNLNFRLELDFPEFCRLVLDFAVSNPDGQNAPVRQVIALTLTQQNFGGRRWWMVCPITGQRARILHLRPGDDRFASREALELAYRSERLTHFDRPFERMFRAQRKLGRAAGLGVEVTRPKGMWRRTFACHQTHFQQLDLACVRQIEGLIEQA
jgi:hypothetical protein